MLYSPSLTVVSSIYGVRVRSHKGVSTDLALHYVFVGSKTYTIENANFLPHAPILLKHGSF